MAGVQEALLTCGQRQQFWAKRRQWMVHSRVAMERGERKKRCIQAEAKILGKNIRLLARLQRRIWWENKGASCSA